MFLTANNLFLEFELFCTDSLFVVYFNKTALESQTNGSYSSRPYFIKFSETKNPECMIDQNNSSNINKDYHNKVKKPTIFATSGTVYIGTNLTKNMCGVNIISDQTSIIYNTTIIVTYGINPSPIIQRETYDYYHVKCIRNRTVNAKLVDEKFDVILKETEKVAKSNNFVIFISKRDIIMIVNGYMF